MSIVVHGSYMNAFVKQQCAPPTRCRSQSNTHKYSNVGEKYLELDCELADLQSNPMANTVLFFMIFNTSFIT